MRELLSDFCENLTEFYQISLKILVYLADFCPQIMACMFFFPSNNWRYTFHVASWSKYEMLNISYFDKDTTWNHVQI